MDDKSLEKFIPKKRNGPTLPLVAGFTPMDDAEEDIRRSLRRHHEQLAKIAELQTDNDHWRNRAQIAEQKVAEAAISSADQDALIAELKDMIATLRAHLQSSVETNLKSLEILKMTPHVKTITAKQLEQPDERTRDQANLGPVGIHRAGGERPDL